MSVVPMSITATGRTFDAESAAVTLPSAADVVFRAFIAESDGNNFSY
jgi:hypothetical protein